MFVILASSYLRSSSSGAPAVAADSLTDKDASAEVNLLLSVDSVQKRLAWTQWIMSAKDFYKQRLLQHQKLLLIQQQRQRAISPSSTAGADDAPQNDLLKSQGSSSLDSGNEGDRETDSRDNQSNSNSSNAFLNSQDSVGGGGSVAAGADGIGIGRRYKLLRYRPPSKDKDAKGIGRVY
jgi:hypothetical protein